MSRQPRLFEPEVPIPEELRAAVEAWLAYKAKRKESYKCVESVADLVERMAEMGAERAMAAVKWSRSQNWSGLYEQKQQDRRPMLEVPGGLPEDWTYLTRDEQRMVLESARNSPEARRRRGEEWWAALSEEERSEIERLREEYQ